MVKIMIDSAADIGAQEAKELGVIMLPMQVTIGEEEYFDGVDLLPEAFYEKLVESGEIPKTSLINQYRFEEAIDEHLEAGTELVIITISSKLSGTYAAAREAASGREGVFVVDSMNVAIGERLLCLYALQLREEGLSARQIVERLEEEKGRINVLAMLSTLEYLKKGGRISAAAAIAGSVFSIKPVVSVVDGEVKVVGKAMGSRKGNNLLNKLIEEKGGVDFSMPFGTTWSGLDRSLHDKYVADSKGVWASDAERVPSYILGATIGTHVGAGVVGVAFFGKR